MRESIVNIIIYEIYAPFNQTGFCLYMEKIMKSYKRTVLFSFLTYAAFWCAVLLLSPYMTELLTACCVFWCRKINILPMDVYPEAIELPFIYLIPFVSILLATIALTFAITKADRNTSVCTAFTLSIFSFLWISALICSYFAATDDSEFLPGLDTFFTFTGIAIITILLLISNLIIWLICKINQKRKC